MSVETPCREYQGHRNEHGYGQRQVKRFRSRYVHKQIIEMAGEDQFGTPFDPDAVVMHLCDNPACFRFDHLRIGTQADNLRDMWEKGRAHRQRQTHCKNGHEFDEANTYMRKDRPGHRECRTCLREARTRRKGGQ